MDQRHITDLPEHIRRRILWVSVVIISIIMVSAWLWWLPKSLQGTGTTNDKLKRADLQELQLELQKSIQNTTRQFENAVAQPAPSDKQIIDSMKQKILEQQNTTTAPPTP